MATNDKFERWGQKRDKWERKSDRLRISRNSEGVWEKGAAVYIRNRDSIGFTLTASEAREVAAAIIAAADEFELILSEPDVLESPIREQVEALPVGSTFRVNFGERYVGEYLRTNTGVIRYTATWSSNSTATAPLDEYNWEGATNLEILHLAG